MKLTNLDIALNIREKFKYYWLAIHIERTTNGRFTYRFNENYKKFLSIPDNISSRYFRHTLIHKINSNSDSDYKLLGDAWNFTTSGLQICYVTNDGYVSVNNNRIFQTASGIKMSLFSVYHNREITISTAYHHMCNTCSEGVRYVGSGYWEPAIIL